MNFNQLLIANDIDPKQVIVVRHKPFEAELARVFPWIVSNRPDLFEMYQVYQTERLEKALVKAKYLAAFVADGAAKALFIGLYEVKGFQPHTREQYLAEPLNQELISRGMSGLSREDIVRRGSVLRFDLLKTREFRDWTGRLVIGWSSDRAWYQWGSVDDRFPVLMLHPKASFEPALPPWRQIKLKYKDIELIPKTWRAALNQWRGIYLIYDTKQKLRYVGSASGAQNMLGRWEEYGRSGHGGNKNLKDLDATTFEFTILELTSPDLPAKAIVSLENNWKSRLHTIWPYGLNEN